MLEEWPSDAFREIEIILMQKDGKFSTIDVTPIIDAVINGENPNDVVIGKCLT